MRAHDQRQADCRSRKDRIHMTRFHLILGAIHVIYVAVGIRSVARAPCTHAWCRKRSKPD